MIKFRDKWIYRAEVEHTHTYAQHTHELQFEWIQMSHGLCTLSIHKQIVNSNANADK